MTKEEWDSLNTGDIINYNNNYQYEVLIKIKKPFLYPEDKAYNYSPGIVIESNIENHIGQTWRIHSDGPNLPCYKLVSKCIKVKRLPRIKLIEVD